MSTTTSVINNDRRIALQETAWTCAYIAKKYVGETEDRNEGRIRVPKSQRLWAWKGKYASKMSALIDSLFHNYPIPSAIINEDDTDGITDYTIYDGRHRFETIWRYANNKFPYQGKYYKDLLPEEKEKFNNRVLPVTIAQNSSPEQLAEIFIRLNAGKPLTDSDMFWANRDCVLIKAVRRLVGENNRLSSALGDASLNYRADLANWTGLVYGLSTRHPGNMTTSYIRISEDEGLTAEVDDVFVRQGLNALCELYELANTETVIPKKDQKKYKKLGFINAFFLSDWMEADVEDRKRIIRKWANLVKLHRSIHTQEKIKEVLSVTGAQNLNSQKIEKVLKRVNDYLDTQEFEEEDDFVEDDDDESQN